MGFIQEFKEFAVKGNVIDLAVGVIIGGAFGKITTSLVSDVLMPPLGLITGGIKFTEIKIPLKAAVLDAAGKVTAEAVTLNVGNFIQNVFDFTLMALAVFVMVKMINNLKKKEEEAPAAPPAPPEPSREEILLTEIRDALLKQKA
ncbi:large conductance mechanosensitive channel protein MscL [bacterium (Candidatus Blackallbacteria) CG17_big_fil_post_rev_8_21_14_2_50_48_46]|uniref:Large-conductance mechanosensitive channel n=1 Tax=bacterium (Candidatus Blackallbacteria) CG17_big_fil_post_rev_8_21_14_2_50_48_46 TaxID=2014261 RepID=A0A2M7FZ73_9BACT|nr:MAG: large conductance mechanosensitive channel protein MscL [bacterium (Candidatus Blackallbacteria) CG18_big_fil_WC_8_21_14_2_50_49_26]PIW14405.1 MAG: large conductance mechanosensitive channel protein MscL [bacterium (Candidatus Blackallbacteria) CG17_big_fil_post_rev_8_21_14_2_50_48_46]PIW46912.1 MAG: large conductance mechanosensitive channel protein MscL [bacterium (Candidatus Blackallbacteria) CG13_big_fil_rev_8_21_14_2_50_49_14]